MESYYGKTRFQQADEVQHRRVQQGRQGTKIGAWAISQAREIGVGGVLFDLACGNGRHLPGLAEGGRKVLAGDVSEGMLKAAREIPTEASVRAFVRLEAERLPLADKSCEVVFSARFFHHLPSRDLRERILCEAFRVSRSGAVITYKARYTFEHFESRIKHFLRRSQPSHQWYFAGEDEFREIAERNGWRIGRRFSPHGRFSANRALVFVPMENGG